MRSPWQPPTAGLRSDAGAGAEEVDASRVQRGLWREPEGEVTSIGGVQAICITSSLRHSKCYNYMDDMMLLIEHTQSVAVVHLHHEVANVHAGANLKADLIGELQA